jgi:adenylate cyclase
VFTDAARPVARHGGRIYQYVGDQMVATWTLEHGLRDWACLRCAFAIGEELARAKESYESQFGAAPRFRLALHCGPVVAGEIGDLRREIVFSGDTLNTTARIEAFAKAAGRDLVVSEILVGQAPLPAEVTVAPLGVQTIAGKEQRLELFAVVPH